MDRRPAHRRRPPPGAPAHAPDAKETAARLAPALGPGMARVPVMAGTGSGLPPGRPAATMRDELVFGTTGPPAEQVAHELVHAAQARRFGPGPAEGGTAAPGAADEREARELTPRVLMGEPVAVRQAPTAPVRLWTPDPEPETRPGAFELRQAAEAYKTDRVIEILAANREPEHMAALRAGYGPAFFRDLERALAAGETRTLWSLATVYIGDQLSLAERIRVEDKVFGRDLDKIMPLIEAISDEEALRIVGGEAPFPRPLDAPPPGVAPAQAFLADVQAALDDALRREDYYQAMNLLLAKASRANAKRWAETGSLLRLQPAPSSQLHVLPSVP